MKFNFLPPCFFCYRSDFNRSKVTTPIIAGIVLPFGNRNILISSKIRFYKILYMNIVFSLC